MKLTLFERLILFSIVEVMHLAGIPVKYKRGFSDFLYRIAKKGELTESDLERFD